MLNSQINIASPISIKTAGLSKTIPRCSQLAPATCAEFYAMAGFSPASGGFFVASNDGVHADHLVIDGNRTARLTSKAAASCRQGITNQLGINIIWGSNSSSFTNSVSRNALCGSALEISARSAIVIENNTFASNGFHNRKFLWSDGITVGDAASSVFRGNLIVDSTDVDLIFGGCQSCEITGNTIIHTGSYAASAFAAIVVHAWPNGGTSGNYTGSEFSGNLVDCGGNRGCGFGITIGAGTWYKSTNIYGAVLHANSVRNAEVGFNIDPASTTGRFDVKIYNNPTTDSGGVFPTLCGTKTVLTNYNITPSSSAHIDRSLDAVPASAYGNMSWDQGCIPNYGGVATAFAMHEGTTLSAGQCKPFGGTALCMQTDSDYVLKNGTAVLWATSFAPGFSIPPGPPTRGKNCPACFGSFETNGNLILSNPSGAGAYWASRTAGNPWAAIMVSATQPYLTMLSRSGGILWTGASRLATQLVPVPPNAPPSTRAVEASDFARWMALRMQRPR